MIHSQEFDCPLCGSYIFDRCDDIEDESYGGRVTRTWYECARCRNRLQITVTLLMRRR